MGVGGRTSPTAKWKQERSELTSHHITSHHNSLSLSPSPSPQLDLPNFRHKNATNVRPVRLQALSAPLFGSPCFFPRAIIIYSVSERFTQWCCNIWNPCPCPRQVEKGSCCCRLFFLAPPLLPSPTDQRGMEQNNRLPNSVWRFSASDADTRVSQCLKHAETLRTHSSSWDRLSLFLSLHPLEITIRNRRSNRSRVDHHNHSQ